MAFAFLRLACWAWESRQVGTLPSTNQGLMPPQMRIWIPSESLARAKGLGWKPDCRPGILSVFKAGMGQVKGTCCTCKELRELHGQDDSFLQGVLRTLQPGNVVPLHRHRSVTG